MPAPHMGREPCASLGWLPPSLRPIRNRAWMLYGIAVVLATPCSTMPGNANSKPSHLHGPAADAHRGLADGLGQRRMRVAGARDVFRRRREFERQRSLADHIADIGPDHVHAEHAVGLGIGDDLHEAL